MRTLKTLNTVAYQFTVYVITYYVSTQLYITCVWLLTYGAFLKVVTHPP